MYAVFEELDPINWELYILCILHLLYPNEGKRAVGPPEWDVNLFILRVGGRGVGGDVAVQGLILGSASVCLCVCLFACPHWVWWVVGERVSGQGPDQTIQESEIYIFVR